MAGVFDQPVKSDVVKNDMKYQAQEFQEFLKSRDQIRTVFVKFDRTDNGTIAIDDLNVCLGELNFRPVFGTAFNKVVGEQIAKAGFADKKWFSFAEFTNLFNRLIDFKLDQVRVVEHYGKTLEDCCRDGDTECVKHLLHKGANVDMLDSSGNLPLIVAAVHGFLPICQLLLKAGADKFLLRCERAYLQDLVMGKNVYKTKLGIEKLYGRVLYERAELAVKCLSGTVEAAEEEYAKRPFGNSSDFGNWKGNPSYVGARPAYVRPPRVALDKKKRQFTKDDLRLGLIAAAKSGSIDEIKKWVEARADINCRDELGNTPLLLAAWGNDLAVVSYLIEVGSKAELRNFRGNTVLHICAEVEHGDHECSKFLRANGADKIADKTNVIGYTQEEVADYNAKHPDHVGLEHI